MGAIRFDPGSPTGTGPAAFGTSELDALEMLWVEILGDLPYDD